ncbi:MAG TPA: response regulator transcription factor [Chitinophagales bacterium]|jgi:DNA-binding NarL/FixJ family response regulator|nr:response regulator transcription factor [Chitinophagales bacterium]HQW79172.1 response regulator transcription factor [Chitinophagales bacterium]HRB67337.1 response regulator transcription factor [Chitinophagales bacterium]HRB67344.1 response regulator transcription factor [Chitinophagales bacterium]HRB69195.1 response regulator transcription factor [Chitinophagales bacterium]
MQEINVFVVDDHQIFLDGIISLLEDEPNIKIVGTAPNGKLALERIRTTKADVVLMDINMPEMDGIEATKQLKKTNPDLKILMLTMHSEPRFIKECLEIGAKGYVLKNISKDDLLKAIETVYQDKPYLDNDTQEKLISSISNADEEDDKNYDELAAQITQRELEILQLIALGLTSQDIATKLFISKNTVETHRKNMLAKLNVNNTAALLKIAYKKGLV